jgi:hypothetical protein
LLLLWLFWKTWELSDRQELSCWQMVNCSLAERSLTTQTPIMQRVLQQEADIFSFALSGNRAVAGIISALAATPREKADAAAVAKIPGLLG